jgi:integrase
MKFKRVTKNIVKTGNTFYSDFTSSYGKRIRRSLGKDLAEAKIKLLQVKLDVEQIQTPSVTHNTTAKKSYKSAVNEFLQAEFKIENAWDRRKFNQYTERQCQMVLTTLKRLKEFADISNLHQVKKPKLKRFIADRSYYVTNSTLNKNIQFVKRFFEWCVDMDYLYKSPARILKKLPEDTPHRYNFNAEEVARILDNAGDFKNYYLVALETGLRPCDLKNLSKKDFIVEDGQMYYRIFSDKTKDYISLPVTDVVRDIVEKAEDAIIPNAKERAWLEALRSNLYSNFDKSYRKKWNIRLHTLRHTFATVALNNGVPKEVIQTLLGHASIKTTEIYSNQLSGKTVLRYIDKIGASSS